MSPDRVRLFALVAGLGMGCGGDGPLDTGPAPVPEPVFGSVLGRVTVDGRPIGGVSVALSLGGERVASRITATSGEYEFLSLEPGIYSVVISQIVGVSCTTLRAATVQGGKRTEVNFACASPLSNPVPHPVPSPVPPGSVMGRVTRNGIGLAGVAVYLCYGQSWWDGCFLPVQYTNSQGRYAYDIPDRLLGTLFADCGPAPWSGALVGPTSARVSVGPGMHQTVNFDCP